MRLVMCAAVFVCVGVCVCYCRSVLFVLDILWLYSYAKHFIIYSHWSQRCFRYCQRTPKHVLMLSAY